MRARLLRWILALVAVAVVAAGADSGYDISVRVEPGTRPKPEVFLEVRISTPNGRSNTHLLLRAGVPPAKSGSRRNGPNGSLVTTTITASLDQNADTVTYDVEIRVDGAVVAYKNGTIDVRAQTHGTPRP